MKVLVWACYDCYHELSVRQWAQSCVCGGRYFLQCCVHSRTRRRDSGLLKSWVTTSRATEPCWTISSLTWSLSSSTVHSRYALWPGMHCGQVCTVAWYALWPGMHCSQVRTVAWYALWPGMHCGLVLTVAWYALQPGMHCGLVCTVAWYALRPGTVHTDQVCTGQVHNVLRYWLWSGPGMPSVAR